MQHHHMLLNWAPQYVQFDVPVCGRVIFSDKKIMDSLDGIKSCLYDLCCEEKVISRIQRELDVG